MIGVQTYYKRMPKNIRNGTGLFSYYSFSTAVFYTSASNSFVIVVIFVALVKFK